MRVLRLIPLFALFIAAPAFAAFSDVLATHPNSEAINYVQAEGIVGGYPDGTYRPDQKINRAEFTKIVTLYEYGQKMVDMCGSRMQFTDLQYDAWYVKYICRAKDGGLIGGYADNTFRPNANINFAEAAKIIASAETNVYGGPVLPEDDGGSWYSRYVRYLEIAHAIPMSIASLDHSLTRGEMAEMIWRLRTGNATKESRTLAQLENPSEVAVSPADGWPVYKNLVVGYSMRYPAESQGMGSNTFAVGEGVCVVDGVLGPLHMSIISRKEVENETYYQGAQRTQLLQQLTEKAEAIWQQNTDERGSDKEVGFLEIREVRGKKAYRFWVTGTYGDALGGWVTKEKQYQLFFEDGGLMYHFFFAAKDEGAVNEMLRTWEAVPASYTGPTLYDAAKACERAY